MEREPVELFPWLRELALGLPTRKGVALLTALDCDGRTGRDIVVNAEWIANVLGITERQVWRHLKTLREQDGLFEQTQMPTFGGKGEKGRRARYRLTLPRGEMSDDSEGCRLTSARGETSDDGIESSDTLGLSRLTLSAESSDIGHAHGCHSLPSDGSPPDGSPSSHLPAQPPVGPGLAAFLRASAALRGKPDE